MSDKKTSKDAERDLLAPVSFDEFKKPTYEQWQAEV
jgi:methylmalonyl-CoA mutase